MKIALANLYKYKLFSAINILGLAVGLATSVIMYLFVYNEFSYDSQWEDKESIFKVLQLEIEDDDFFDHASISGLVLPALQEYFGVAIAQTSHWRREYFREVEAGDTYSVQDIYFVSESFPQMFQFRTLQGNLDDIFEDPNSIALNEGLARQWFGETDPVGQIISVKNFISGDVRNYQVDAVFQLAVDNSTFQIGVMGGDVGINQGQPDSKNGRDVEGYIKLDSGIDISSIRSKLPDFVEQYVSHSELGLDEDQSITNSFSYELIAIEDLYFDPLYCASWNAGRCGNLSVVTSFAMLAILVLLVACVNYITLALAKSGRRAKEVALRKVSGANFSQLVLQFMGESLAVILLALFLAIALVEISLPIFISIMDINLKINFDKGSTYLFFAASLVVICLTAGLYPALVISRIKPATTLKSNQDSIVQGRSNLGNILLFFQFGVTISLLIATAIVFTQLNFINQRDPGFSPNDLIELNLTQLKARTNSRALQQGIAGLSQVESVTLSGTDPGQDGGIFMFANYSAVDENNQNDPEISTISVGYSFFETFSMPLVAGRSYQRGRDREEPSNSLGLPQEDLKVFQDGSLILNESAVRLLGFASPEEAIGKSVSADSFQINGEKSLLTIIGVVKDSQYRTLREVAGPVVYRLSTDDSWFLTLRYDGDPQILLLELEIVWSEVVGDSVFIANFIENELAGTFQAEKTQAGLLVTFAVLAVFIACLGLYGVTAFSIDRRTKEIGIRKVMGAEVRNISSLLIWQFSKPVLVANIIAWPVGVWTMLPWLQRFPYQIDTVIIIPLCVSAGLIALSIAWLTVVGSTLKVATTNPLYALRYE